VISFLLSQFRYEVESDNLLSFISHVVNRISACRTHAFNINDDSKILKNQLMTACRFQSYSFSLQLRRCRIVTLLDSVEHDNQQSSDYTIETLRISY